MGAFKNALDKLGCRRGLPVWFAHLECLGQLGPVDCTQITTPVTRCSIPLRPLPQAEILLTAQTGSGSTQADSLAPAVPILVKFTAEIPNPIPVALGQLLARPRQLGTSLRYPTECTPGLQL